ncbi:BREX-1 system adenine-specific DNA-methyltransferase PglX [Achromobacter sp. MFA1 R4]|uniref:BREX-1 system adenine-specific DNA-methyltransferase PglX n=1 Tax=Achromobacter sp. MFA1 R4 TaxID=1881016 RepID=UPI000953737D|nr:BREX-1 system adenine-specific DNA-methyltransferase PglX [Achromobacter sp. MFA1 R4]SIT20010.1 hypothetical protein SAMN05428937_1895 [Achromobacter sp. MFA1 R4]
MSENENISRNPGIERYFFRASTTDFNKIPGSPITYSLGVNIRNSFSQGELISRRISFRSGLLTGDNDRFQRYWHEIGNQKFAKPQDSFVKSGGKWFPCHSGGTFRKWYGNHEVVVNWENDGSEIKEFKDAGGRLKSRPQNTQFYFREGLTYPKISSGLFNARYRPKGFVFDDTGRSAFGKTRQEERVALSFLCSKVATNLLEVLCPTLSFNTYELEKLPFDYSKFINSKFPTEDLIKHSKLDWDSYETSWDFTTLPLLHPDHCQPTLKARYQKLRTRWREMSQEMQRLEEENNRIFIDAYGLQDELTPEVPLEEITLTCNPYYRYGGDKSEEELEALLLADTMRELVSYAVGCMVGRYSLDKPGLILANQGEALADYLAQVPDPSFPVDDDNVVPMLDGDWFADDITLRVRQFLRVAFGNPHYEDNLAFIEQALNVKGKRNYSLRDYLLGEFYADHLKRYKKRPIYWLFSSPKGSFNALIYMHRYRSDTVSVVLRYLQDYREKLTSERNRQTAISINPDSSQGDKTRALKEADRLGKVLAELEDYERDVLYPLATEQVQIDLDDGVKVNYLKFGTALKKIPGLAAKDED